MISFIVPAFNEEQLLGRTLSTLNASAAVVGEPFEIVVADDASTDRTSEIAREQGARVVRCSHRQIAATRNAGARASVGDQLIFVDADTVVSAEVVRAAVLAMKGGAVGGGCSFSFDGVLPIYARMLLALTLPAYRLAGLASGCFLFCTRQAFDAVGGFDENLFAAEEAAFSKALHKQGTFIILREAVMTSGRKLRSHSPREILWLVARFLLRGPKILRRREGLGIWYSDRRLDPLVAEGTTTSPLKSEPQ